MFNRPIFFSDIQNFASNINYSFIDSKKYPVCYKKDYAQYLFLKK